MDKRTDIIQQNEDPGFNTIFDDVFRTIAQKMPYLLIPLINEVFGTEYGEDQEFIQLRNEHYEKFGKVITDSIIQIGGHLYHIECQSEKDGSITVRILEYDFAIAMEHTTRSEDGMVEIEFQNPAYCTSEITGICRIITRQESVFRTGRRWCIRFPLSWPRIIRPAVSLKSIFYCCCPFIF